MQSGDVLGDRFELEHRAASGGMGQVFRARDRLSGAAVAVKVILEPRGGWVARFEREVAVLSGLTHPGIVRYVAHGAAPSGESYLVMEWLEGEDLSSRLERGPLGLVQTLSVGMQVSAALATTHALGFVHRDLKPGNLWLSGGELSAIKVLDFGIASVGGATTMTRTGTVLGTPRYMAPEQAKGDHSIDARTDVFALGCVLFECLTGAPAFTGDSVMAVLAKILFQEPPRLIDVLPDAPADLDDLLARALAKSQDERPRDGAALLEELRAITPSERAFGAVPSAPRPNRSSLTGTERRMLSVVLVAAGEPPSIDAPTIASGAPVSAFHDLQRVAAACGGRLELLAEGTAVVTFARGNRIASDQAVQAARCALGVRALGRHLPVTIATGRTELTGQLPLGDAIDRAARMLVERAGVAHAAIGVDAVTAGLLDARFEIVAGPAGLELRAEHALPKGTRTLLGKATTCVGRDWELNTIEQLFGACVEERQSRAVLVTAPAGMGKSRLANELVRRLGEAHPQLRLWLARADSLRSGSALGLLGQAVRAALGLHESEPLSQRQAGLRAAIDARFDGADRERVALFLGELTGTPYAEDLGAPLKAARRDAQVMNEQMLRAWLDFVAAETASGPVLLLLEDLHWGDLPTVRFIDAALRQLSDRPLLVLALARPEVHKLFPQLWAERHVQEIRLKELSRKACEALVRQVLGDNLTSDTLERLIERAEGHAFYLEELIRAVADGGSSELPDTVLAMVQARLGALDPEIRRVLRAASVFGEVCWQGGIAALLGDTMRSTQARENLMRLIDQELLVARPDSRFARETEYTFRHALLREGVYAMLTDSDQALGHRLAGEWLEQHGEADPTVLAEHFERGQVPAKASVYYLRAAQQAGCGGDPDAAIAAAHRGLALEAADDVASALHGLLVEAHTWQGESILADTHAEHVIRLAAPNSIPRVTATAGRFVASLALGRPREVIAERLAAALHAIETTLPTPEGAAYCARGSASVAYCVDLIGRFDVAETHLRKMYPIFAPLAEQDVLTAAWLNIPHAHHTGLVADRAWHALQRAKLAHSLFQQAGHSRGSAAAVSFIGINAHLLGANAEADAAFSSTQGIRLAHVSGLRSFFSIQVQIELGQFEPAEQQAQRLLEDSRAAKATPDEGRARAALAQIRLRRGELAEAEREARSAVALLQPLPAAGLQAQMLLAKILLAAAHPEALVEAQAAMTQHAALQTLGYRGPLGRSIPLVYAEALHVAGQTDLARVALQSVRERVQACAAEIDDPAYRESFLEHVPDNARILALANAWS